MESNTYYYLSTTMKVFYVFGTAEKECDDFLIEWLGLFFFFMAQIIH